RGWGTSGFTLAKKPYSPDAWRFHVVGGWLETRVILTIDLIPLKPYFQGTTSRSGAPFCGVTLGHTSPRPASSVDAWLHPSVVLQRKAIPGRRSFDPADVSDRATFGTPHISRCP